MKAPISNNPFVIPSQKIPLLPDFENLQTFNFSYRGGNDNDEKVIFIGSVFNCSWMDL